MSEEKGLRTAEGAPGYGAPDQIQMTPALQCLARQSGLEVQEKANVLEAVTALLGAEIEMANRYRVFDASGREELFYAVEETDCCTRQLKQCCPDCAPWNLSIFHTEGGQSSPAFKLERATTCTCCCFNRPVVNILDATTNRSLGSIKDPWACCDLTFALRDTLDQEIARVKGGCCQWGLCCPLPCGPCSRVQFDFTTRNDEDIGSMVKKVPSCLMFLFASDVDNYKVDFGKLTSSNDDARKKLLLMALTIFVDFRYFNDNRNDDLNMNEV